LEPIVAEAMEHARFRDRILVVARGALEQLRLDLEMTRFDLDATRREREDLRRLVARAREGGPIPECDGRPAPAPAPPRPRPLGIGHRPHRLRGFGLASQAVTTRPTCARLSPEQRSGRSWEVCQYG
jgi:hypothetical protein